MEITTPAICLKSVDYKENDRIILLYSLRYGKISVHAKGIRKGNAKLKFAADQFCFGQYELICNGDRKTLKTCSQLESFYCLREDISVYYAACAVAECLVNYTEEEQPDGVIFAETLRAFQALTDGIDPLAVTLRYILEFLRVSGFALQTKTCAVCGCKTSKAFLDTQRGDMVCSDCRSAQSVAVSAGALSACRLFEGVPYGKLPNITVASSVLKDALTFVNKYISCNFPPIKTLSELVRLA